MYVRVTMSIFHARFYILGTSDLSQIQESIDEWNQFTCLDIRPAQGEFDRIVFMDDCWYVFMNIVKSPTYD